MTHRAADDHRRTGQPSEMPSDLAAVQADDAMLDGLATARMGDDTEETFRLLAAHRRACQLNDSGRALIDTDTALAAMQVNVGRPFVVAVTLLTVMIMIGATLGVVVAYLVTDWLSVLVWGPTLGALALALAVSVVLYRECQR